MRISPGFASLAVSLVSLATGALASELWKRQALIVPDSPRVNWTYTGCYTDNVAQRTLSLNSYLATPMTNALCAEFCEGMGFAYAGTEYSQECFCGNAVQNDGSLVDTAECNMPCSGNVTEACGSANRLTLFNTTLPPESDGPFVNPGVNGYRSLGCYSDDIAARTLSSVVQVAGGTQNVTVGSCTSACSAGGYAYAGVEYSGECYCGDAIANDGAPVDSSACNMVCNGNATEYCGGPSRMNLYTKRQAPDGWNLLGCYTDSVAQRTLATRVFPPGDLTTTSCLATCRSAGYVLAGTEYGGECYCGNTLSAGGPAPDGNAGCNMPCNGNPQEICGGPNRLTFYEYGNGSIPSPTSTSSLPTSTTSATALPTGLPTGWDYKGCWVDNVDGRILSFQQPDDSQLTIQSCIAKCSNLGFSVAGMQYSSQCFCDNFVRRGGELASDDAQCSSACAGNPAQKCGGGNRNSIYSNNTELEVIPVPSPQSTNLTGDWHYVGCIRDDAPDGVRALPYQIILKTNNSANNCISQCSAFGYNAGGLEYGEECYCGDTRDVISLGGPINVSESECNIACTGSPAYLCGGSRRLSYYEWRGEPLALWDYPQGNAAGAYQFLIGGVVIPLVTQVARNGKVTFLEKAGTGAPNTTGAYELDLAQVNNFTGAWRPMHVKTDVFCSASLTLPDKAGRQLNVGGWALDSTFGVRLYWPDGSPGVWGQNDWQENVNELHLQNGRWYPTSMILPNGSVLVVGGQSGANGPPVPTLEILPKVGPVLFCDWLQRTDPNNLYPFMAALPHGDIFVAYWNEAIILDETTLEVKRQLPNMPGAVNNFLAGRTYPMEGSAILLPQHAPSFDLEIIICGGSSPLVGVALDNCVRINPEDTAADWTIERMPSKRVLTCMTGLPDGTLLILNGAHQGFAGFGLASDPNHNAVLYDPSKPVHQRFSVMANTTIDRLYHSEAILLDDGRVLVSGSDPEDNIHPQEYRVEVFVPPYLMNNPVQPTLELVNFDWGYGEQVIITASEPIVKISLIGAESSTHGNSMGQRTMFPAMSCSGNTCTVTAPPNAHACPPGWFRLFGLTAEGVPSVAKWVRIGGDPAGLGNWPGNSTTFHVPGI